MKYADEQTSTTSSERPIHNIRSFTDRVRAISGQTVCLSIYIDMNASDCHCQSYSTILQVSLRRHINNSCWKCPVSMA
jgi:hypothetical protein